jgi:hypothetical protein
VPRDTRRAIYVAVLCLNATHDKTLTQNRNTIQALQLRLGDERLMERLICCRHPLTVDGAGESTRVLFAILIKGCLFRVGLFIIACVVVVPSLSLSLSRSLSLSLSLAGSVTILSSLSPGDARLLRCDALSLC